MEPRSGPKIWETNELIDVSKMNNIEKNNWNNELNFGVTPQMFGALGNGENDDTQAFQDAIDYCGTNHVNLFVPTNRGQVYKITQTLDVDNTCAIYGDGGWFSTTSSGGYIKFVIDQTGKTDGDLQRYPLFNIKTNCVLIQGLKFVCANKDNNTDDDTKRIGRFLQACKDSNDQALVDCDLQLRNLQIGNFYRGILFNGRGCTVQDCHFNRLHVLAAFTWSKEPLTDPRLTNDANHLLEDTNTNHPPYSGQRAITFKNCRIHSIQSSFISILSGHAYGFTFVNNTIDVGRRPLIKAETHRADNWLIANNTILGILDESPIVWFCHGARNCIISNNVFSSDMGFWKTGNVGATDSPPHWIRIDGLAEACNITANVFQNCSSSAIVIDKLYNSVISSNSFVQPNRNNLAESTFYDSVINIKMDTKYSAIIGNTVANQMLDSSEYPPKFEYALVKAANVSEGYNTIQTPEVSELIPPINLIDDTLYFQNPNLDCDAEGYRGTSENLRNVSFYPRVKPNTAYTVSFDGRCVEKKENITVSIAVFISYTDGTSSRTGQLNNDPTTEFSRKSVTSNAAKTISRIFVGYVSPGRGTQDIWEIKNLALIEGNSTVYVPYVEEYTAVDKVARRELEEIRALLTANLS